MRSQRWSLPCLICLGALSACSGSPSEEPTSGSGAGGSGTTTGPSSGGTSPTGAGGSGATTPSSGGLGGTGGSGGFSGSGGSGGDPLQCPATTLFAAACLAPEQGFGAVPPLMLDLVATVTEVGEGDAPLGCWQSSAKVFGLGAASPPPVWARLEDDMMQEWVVGFSVPALQAGFNGHITAGDVVQVSLYWEDVPPEFVLPGYLIASLQILREDVLVAFVGEHATPAWYKGGDAVCGYPDECCGITGRDATADVNGESGVVPYKQTATIGGLAISNLEYTSYEDLGCCNFFGTREVAIAAVPAP